MFRLILSGPVVSFTVFDSLMDLWCDGVMGIICSLLMCLFKILFVVCSIVLLNYLLYTCVICLGVRAILLLNVIVVLCFDRSLLA